jgi:hypothetical protein
MCVLRDGTTVQNIFSISAAFGQPFLQKSGSIACIACNISLAVTGLN